MVLDNFYPDPNTDGYRIKQFLAHRIVSEICFDDGIIFMDAKEFEESLRIFEILLLEGPIFAKGPSNKIKTFKVNVVNLDSAKLPKLDRWITEIR